LNQFFLHPRFKGKLKLPEIAAWADKSFLIGTYQTTLYRKKIFTLSMIGREGRQNQSLLDGNTNLAQNH